MSKRVLLVDAFFVIGLIAVTSGLWLISPALALMFFGAVLIGLAVLFTTAIASTKKAD